MRIAEEIEAYAKGKGESIEAIVIGAYGGDEGYGPDYPPNWDDNGEHSIPEPLRGVPLNWETARAVLNYGVGDADDDLREVPT